MSAKFFINPLFWILILLVFASLRLFFLTEGNKKARKALWFLFGLIVVLYLVSIQPTSALLAYPLEARFLSEKTREAPLDYIVVLSGGARRFDQAADIYPNDESLKRLIHGISVARKNSSAILILSGGNGVPGESSEAYAMKRIIDLYDIDSRIILEEESRNTHEQARKVRKIIGEQRASVGIVTSGIHMLRGERTFRKYFDNVTALPVKLLSGSYKWQSGDMMPSGKNISQVRSILIEYIGNLWYRLLGRAHQG